MRPSWFAAVVLTVAGTFAAHAASADPVKIRAAWVVPAENWSSILFAKRGLAKHLGRSYTFEPVRFQGAAAMTVAMANGELEIADFAFPAFALAVQNSGMDDLRIIAGGFQDGVTGHYTAEFLVLKESSIRSIAELKGKVLATNAAGTAVDIAMRAALRRSGLDETRDVRYAESALPSMKSMLLGKRADLIPGVVPFSLDPQLRNASRVLFTQKQIMGRTQMLVWVAREEFIRENRAALVDLMEDALRAARWWTHPRNHREAVQIAAGVSKRSPQFFEKWLFVKAGQGGDYYRAPHFRPNLKALQASVDTQRRLGFLKAEIDVSSHADLSLVGEAARRLR